MGTHLKLTASDGHKLDAYRVDPAGTAKGGIVVIQGGGPDPRPGAGLSGRILPGSSHTSKSFKIYLRLDCVK